MRAPEQLSSGTGVVLADVDGAASATSESVSDDFILVTDGLTKQFAGFVAVQ